MKLYDYIFIDFDGTLMDTSPGVFKSFDTVIAHYGLEKPSASAYNRMIGPPLSITFSQIFHFPQSEISNAIKVYRGYYAKEGMFDAKVYDGMVDFLKALREAGKKVYVATSKPEEYARKILRHFGMDHLFDYIGGSDTTEKGRISKLDVLNYVIEHEGLDSVREQSLLVGDTRFDVEGAKAAGIDCLGVLYGFGTKESLEEAGAVALVSSPREAQKYILGA